MDSSYNGKLKLPVYDWCKTLHLIASKLHLQSVKDQQLQ